MTKTNRVSIQYNLFFEGEVSEERINELKKTSFLFTYHELTSNRFQGIFENVCSRDGVVYYRCVS